MEWFKALLCLAFKVGHFCQWFMWHFTYQLCPSNYSVIKIAVIYHGLSYMHYMLKICSKGKFNQWGNQNANMLKTGAWKLDSGMHNGVLNLIIKS